MTDLREYKETIKAAVQEVNETANWKWTATIEKQEIKLTNAYIRGQYERDHFTIKVKDFSDCMYVRDCLNDSCGTLLVGNDPYYDGDIEICIGKAVHECQRYFETCY